MTAPGPSRVIQVGAGDEELLAAFYRAVWDRGASAETVRRARLEGHLGPTFLFVHQGRALGHVTALPIRLRVQGEELPAHWLKGLMVLPEERNGPVGFLVLREAVKSLGRAMAMVVQPAPRRLFATLGFTDLGPVPNFVRLLAPGRVLARLDLGALGVGGLPGLARRALPLLRRPLLAKLAGSGLAALFRLRTLPSDAGRRTWTVGAPAEADRGEVDALWRRTAEWSRASPVRDAAYLLERYSGRSRGIYRFVSVREADALTALAVVREPRRESDARLQGLRAAVLSDLLTAPGLPASATSAIAGAEAVARDAGADALLCSMSHPAAGALLRRRAFIGFGGNVHFLAHDPARPGRLPADLADWWVTRGDSDADEVF